MLNDAFDVIDLEKRYANSSTSSSTVSVGEKSSKLRTKVGGFDLVYNDGPVKHERTTNYYSYLGCFQPIPRAPRTKKRLGGGASQRDQ
jgi:tubulin polyglutamylase TTLL9